MGAIFIAFPRGRIESQQDLMMDVVGLFSII